MKRVSDSIYEKLYEFEGRFGKPASAIYLGQTAMTQLKAEFGTVVPFAVGLYDVSIGAVKEFSGVKVYPVDDHPNHIGVGF